MIIAGANKGQNMGCIGNGHRVDFGQFKNNPGGFYRGRLGQPLPQVRQGLAGDFQGKLRRIRAVGLPGGLDVLDNNDKNDGSQNSDYRRRNRNGFFQRYRRLKRFGESDDQRFLDEFATRLLVEMGQGKRR